MDPADCHHMLPPMSDHPAAPTSPTSPTSTSSAPTPGRPTAPAANPHEAPPTLEGHGVLHDAYRLRWSEWRDLGTSDRRSIANEAAAWIAAQGAGRTGLYSEISQKGDLVLLHYRPTVDDLNRAEREWRNLRIADFLDPAWSYLALIEASLYEASAIAHRTVAEKGLRHGTPEHQAALEQELTVQRTHLEARVRRDIPPHRYLCFYPMDKRRGEQVNWYNLPVDERRAIMRDHGRIGHKYHNIITQVVGGSIGLDDWEWGVTLHCDEVVPIKRLITEMRFDPSSSLYAQFGEFHFAIRQKPEDLPAVLDGKVI